MLLNGDQPIRSVPSAESFLKASEVQTADAGGSELARSKPSKMPRPPKMPNWKKLNLRTKATALAIALGTLPVLAIGTAAYLSANDILVQQITNTKQSDVIGLTDKVNRFMFERYGDVQVLARLPILANYKVRMVVPIDERSVVLTKFAQTYGVYDSIAAFDLEGNLVVQSAGQPLGNHRDRVYFQEVLKTGKPVISAPEISKSSGEEVIHFAAPIRDNVTGQIIGVVRSRMPIKYLDNVVKSYAFNGTDYHIIDEAGKIFVADETDQIGHPGIEQFPGLNALQAAGKPDTTLLKEGSGQGEQFIAYAPFPTLEGLPLLKWDAVITTETETAFAPQHALLTTLLLGMGLTTLAVAALATWLANRATRPLTEAALAVERIGLGELNTRLAVNGEDELAVLGANINLMAGQLGDTLRQQAEEAERTQLFSAIALKIRQSINLEEILSLVVQEVRTALEVDRVVVYRFNPDWSGYIASEDVGSGYPQALNERNAVTEYINNGFRSGASEKNGLEPMDATGEASKYSQQSFSYGVLKSLVIEDPCITPDLIEAYRKGRVVPTSDVLNAGFHPDHLKLMESLKIKANLVTSIVVQGELFGLLIAHHCGQTHDWQPQEIDFMVKIAVQLGYAVEQSTSVARIEQARLEARAEADDRADQQKQEKEFLQKRALELLMEVDPVSRGDLTIRASVTPDEVGTIADSYNAIIRSLRQIVQQVQDASQSVTETASSSEMAVSTLSAESKQQMHSIAGALVQIQGMVESIQGVANRAKQAEQSVLQASQTIQAGDDAMNRTVSGISEIRETVAETSKKVKRLGEASQKISKVVSLIGSFAAQTNLLALNAAIEAARAGEEGRGFAVVAEEVRSLAQQSATATAEIELLVEEIQAQTNEVVAAMESGTEQVVTGTRLVEETRQKLSQITAVSSQINRLVKEISQATAVQTQASTTVSQTMEQVAAIASDTSKQSEAVANSFGQLVQVAQGLQVSVAQFKVK